jgi:lysophospholipase L1-like esterase
MAVRRRKFIVFAVLAFVLVIGASVVLALAADLVLHHRAERSAGLNRWGYRGPVIAAKQPGEVRIAMFGGSTVFGYGVTWNESIPALLEQRLNQQHAGRHWTAINLGYNTEGAHAFVANLDDFAYLDYDVVVLYEGYNDLLGDLSPNRVTVRQQSPVFRATGYFPILPLWLSEKSLMLRTGGTVGQAYDQALNPGQQTVFRPNLAGRASASALEAAAAVAGALERQLDRAGNAVPAATASHNPFGCPAPWGTYCEAEHRAIQYALEHGKRVLVVSQPQLAAETARQRHQQQQRALADMLKREYAGVPRVTHLDVGTLVNLSDPNVCFDQMHLNVDGNRIVADALVDPVFQLSARQ